MLKKELRLRVRVILVITKVDSVTSSCWSSTHWKKFLSTFTVLVRGVGSAVKVLLCVLESRGISAVLDLRASFDNEVKVIDCLAASCGVSNASILH